ncbi:leucine-rich repeat protein [Candidatus Izemoplasma sp. B36]|uniref:leucine-rich repeat protein n=1 Tax=Candidatus Izemoplasma sp. B36 TaxID=3242468 RepID=UPI0035583289
MITGCDVSNSTTTATTTNQTTITTTTQVTSSTNTTVVTTVIQTTQEVTTLPTETTTFTTAVTNPDDATPSDQFIFTLLSDDTYEITEYIGGSSFVVIPSIYNEKYVTSIASLAFFNETYLVYLKIPSTINNISEDAILGNHELSTIEVDEFNQYYTTYTGGLFTKDKSELLLCPSKLNTTFFIVPVETTTIHADAFMNNNTLLEIDIRGNLESIGHSQFIGCSNLHTITVSENSQYYSSIDGVLYNKNQTELIRYPQSRLAENDEYVIPEGVTEIDEFAFSETYYVYDITFPSTLTHIKDRAFINSNISELYTPDSLISIGEFSFANCAWLHTISLSSSVEELGLGAFSNSLSLFDIQLDSQNNSFSLNDDILYSKDMTKLILVPYYKKMVDFVVPYGVTDICSFSIQNYYIDRIILPDTVTTIHSSAIYRNPDLKEIILSDSVIFIDTYAIVSNESLTKIEIPTTVTSIMANAFYNCPLLILYVEDESLSEYWDIDWNSSSNLVAWGATLTERFIVYFESFDGTSINPIVLEEGQAITSPDNVYKFGCMFSGWYTEPEYINEYVFSSIPEHDLVLYAKWVDLQPEETDFEFDYNDEFQFYILSSYIGTDTEITIPNTYNGMPVLVIGSYAFMSNNDIEVVNISKSISYIAPGAFGNAVNLREVNFEADSQLMYMENSVFSGCLNLKKFIMPSSVLYIGEYIFKDCIQLKYIELSENIEYIGNHAFKNCSQLKNIILPDSLLFIDSYVFDECPELTIYSVLTSSKEDWEINWNFDELPVVWGFTGSINIITYESNGGSYVEETIQASGTSLTQPMDPVLEGYTLVGWFIDPELTTEYIFDVMPSENIMLYAKWVSSESTITFDTNGGSLIEPITQETGSVIIYPENPVKEGYTFDGWFTEPELINGYQADFMPNEDLTLYASWIENATITIYPNDGSEPILITQAINSALEISDLSSDYFTFEGYYLEADFITLFLLDIMPEEDLNIYAKWSGSTSITIDDIVYTITPQAASITSYLGYESELIIPSEILGYIPVSRIHNAAFKDSGIYEIYIPKTITSIGSLAFNNSLVNHVYFEENSSLTIIEQGAFAQAVFLKQIVLPESLNSIGEWAFSGCGSLRVINLPINVNYIGNFAFDDCPDLVIFACASEIQPQWIYFVENYFEELHFNFESYYNGSSLKYALFTDNTAMVLGSNEDLPLFTVNIPELINGHVVRKISRAAFYNNSDINYVNIPGTVTEIGNLAFYLASSLINVNFHSSSELVVIGAGAFAFCTNLTDFVIPDSVDLIGDYAFVETLSLSEIVIPIGVDFMLKDVFSNSNITTIYCEAASQPVTWDNDWNTTGITVVWGYSG